MSAIASLLNPGKLLVADIHIKTVYTYITVHLYYYVCHIRMFV